MYGIFVSPVQCYLVFKHMKTLGLVKIASLSGRQLGCTIPTGSMVPLLPFCSLFCFSSMSDVSTHKISDN